ncbi:MAG: hypothetical protein QOI24_1215 [Acidobacteriota bacterium]|nr:hypothetical protein [Acidobacteriota bacterium]
MRQMLENPALSIEDVISLIPAAERPQIRVIGEHGAHEFVMLRPADARH